MRDRRNLLFLDTDFLAVRQGVLSAMTAAIESYVD
jgi:hypothetical protein